ncbi:MAG: antibiotic biosynthesis monooxygenase [Candidatus Nanopelagicales bacterium]|nr:antibiotic biosynthesis monooxygenase [Candidatus Nanopelagicales bacterium]
MTVAVIFISTRTAEDDPGYANAAARMENLAAAQPGFLGIDSVRDASGQGITVSYWSDDAAARAWKQVAEHLEAQRLGREVWYSQYRVIVAEVTREYRGPQ